MVQSEIPSGPVSSVRRPGPLSCPEPNVRDPREDEELINQFPLLIPRPVDKKLRSDFEEQYSILVGEAIRFRELLSAMARARSQVRRSKNGSEQEAMQRALQDLFSDNYDLSPETFERDAQIFTASIIAARSTIQFVLQEYFPLRLRKPLEMTTEVGSAYDPVQLIWDCAIRGDDIHSRIQQFEVRRQLTFAQIEFELMLNAAGPQDLSEHLGWFVNVCDERFFIPKKSEQLTVIAELNPENANRIREFKVLPSKDPESRTPPAKNQFIIPLSVRFIPSPDSGNPIPVYLETRMKQHIPLKLVKKRQRRHETLTDLCGAKFVFFDEDHDLVAGVERLRKKLVRAPGTVSGEASNMARAGALDPRNAHSSAEYRARKYDVRLRNRHFELQFMYLPYYLNEQVSQGSDNHPLYKLSQYLDLLFPVIFPTELYGLDWRDMALREELWNYQLARI